MAESLTWVVAVMERTKVGTVEQLRFSRRPCRMKKRRGLLVWRTAKLCSDKQGDGGAVIDATYFVCKKVSRAEERGGIRRSKHRTFDCFYFWTSSKSCAAFRHSIQDAHTQTHTQNKFSLASNKLSFFWYGLQKH